MGAPVLVFQNYIFGDDDNSDPDNCTWDTETSPRSGVVKSTPFMVRLQVEETAGNDTQNKLWQLYYNTVNDPSTAVSVTTAGTVVQMVDGTPTDGTVVDDSTVMTAAPGGGTWQDGKYCESDDTDKLLLVGSQYTEFQFCIQAGSSAGDSTTYYLYLRFNDVALDTENATCSFTTEAGAATGLLDFERGVMRGAGRGIGRGVA